MERKEAQANTHDQNPLGICEKMFNALKMSPAFRPMRRISYRPEPGKSGEPDKGDEAKAEPSTTKPAPSVGAAVTDVPIAIKPVQAPLTQATFAAPKPSPASNVVPTATSPPKPGPPAPSGPTTTKPVQQNPEKLAVKIGPSDPVAPTSTKPMGPTRPVPPFPVDPSTTKPAPPPPPPPAVASTPINKPAPRNPVGPSTTKPPAAAAPPPPPPPPVANIPTTKPVPRNPVGPTPAKPTLPAPAAPGAATTRPPPLANAGPPTQLRPASPYVLVGTMTGPAEVGPTKPERGRITKVASNINEKVGDYINRARTRMGMDQSGGGKN